MTESTITFTFSLATGLGRVVGGGWDITYQGCADALAAWMFANADGFYLAPGASFGLHHTPTEMVRA